MMPWNSNTLLSLKSKLLWMVWAAILVAIDQFSKVFAVQNLENQPPLIWLGGTIRIEFAKNLGAFGSLGAGLSESQRFWVFAVGNAVLLSGLLIYLLARKDISRYQFAAFGLIFTGGVGNLIDRATRGYVIDFMNIGIGEWPRTNIFNVADMYIVAGFVMLIPILLQGAPATEATADGTPSTSGRTVNQPS